MQGSRLFRVLTAVAITWLYAAPVSAADKVWNDHAWPYTFLFGNHIDTHQETHLWKTDFLGGAGIDKGDLTGFFYVFDSGETLDDGTPVLRHCTQPEHYVAGCVAGWRMHGKPCIEEVNGCRAMYLYHYHDHPPWLLNPTVDDTGNLRGSRQPIVQPGSFTHMHWLTEGATSDEGVFFPSSIDEVEAVFGVDIHVDPLCNVAMASQLTTGAICPGYFLQLHVLKPFGYHKWAFQHGGEKLVVTPGIDNKTHLNLLTTYQVVTIPENVLNTLPSHGGEHGDEEDGGSGGDSHTGGSGH